MEQLAVPGAGLTAGGPEETGLDSLQFCEDIHNLISVPTEHCGGSCSSSFTALLELPPSQAVELLHSPDPSLVPRPGFDPTPNPYPQFEAGNLTFPTNKALVERAAKFSVFAAGENSNNNNNNNNGYSSPEPTRSVPSNSSGNLGKAVKMEPAEAESSQPLVSDPSNQRPPKRKEREKKAKASSKKSKSGAANESSEDAENLPYVHVRARRGQATDSHSLAERARREKINARMKLLQELVPGCSKISGTALVLDEIINHVQNLQRQVELLSMKLAEVNPTIDFNLDSILAAEILQSGSLMENNFPGMGMPVTWPEVQVNGNRQQYQSQWHFDGLQQPVWVGEEGIHDFVTPENSLLSFDSSANSASLRSNQLKREL